MPTITNIHTEEDATGVRIRIEGEGDILQGQLTVMVRPTEEAEMPGNNEDSAGSETSDWGQPDVLPVDMGFGHFMLNLQTGVIQWCPSGTMQPDASPDWVVMNDPNVPTDPAHEQMEAEPHCHCSCDGHANVVHSPLPSNAGQDREGNADFEPEVNTVDATASSGIDSGEEQTTEVWTDLIEASNEVSSQ